MFVLKPCALLPNEVDGKWKVLSSDLTKSSLVEWFANEQFFINLFFYPFPIFPIMSLCMKGYNSRSLFLHGYNPVGNFGSRFVRDERSFYESDKRPELQATHEKDFIVLKCSVKVRVQNAEIYLLCPASGDRRGMGHCYQGCTPTNPCPDPSHREQKMCVPNNQTVFCKQEKFANGTTTVEVRVDRTDPRLSGTWYCTYTGLKSTEFKVSLRKLMTSAVICENNWIGNQIMLSIQQSVNMSVVEDWICYL